ncbi:hypothetical protein IWQ47_000285 [Aquimarina sp. EL_43]|uniref:hypothetical protein n=1 Tax=unclassified Aquimarina TaxID=2627091 RepID=UPI0018C96619|nr:MULTISPECIES: hypothetical protein [unclassified Aquimarina]MBG6129023.1 hypothetical protein [Aquimarina sp. EL_35]MBG6150087.1 hypothetical protein [Aquimarina sp. EL_32]MBG6167227.1 hypothetical protein [Aquimarina sp. EL_43]
MRVDHETLPKCMLEEKKFSWGEPYLEVTPIFDTLISQELSNLEFCIEIFIKNNFRNQLLEFYNVLTNYEENDRIENFEGTLSEQLRKEMLLKIKIELDSEKKLTPWEKYKEYREELDFLYIFEEEFDRKIVFIKPK